MKRPGTMVSEVLRNATRTPATTHYPFVKIEMPDKFRAKLKFYPEKCIGCKACMRDCPSNAITINKVGDKQFEAVFDLDKCIYCAQCVDSCVKKALEATKDYELAQIDRAKLKVIFHANPPQAGAVSAPRPDAEKKPA